MFVGRCLPKKTTRVVRVLGDEVSVTATLFVSMPPPRVESARVASYQTARQRQGGYGAGRDGAAGQPRRVAGERAILECGAPPVHPHGPAPARGGVAREDALRDDRARVVAEQTRSAIIGRRWRSSAIGVSASDRESVEDGRRRHGRVGRDDVERCPVSPAPMSRRS